MKRLLVVLAGIALALVVAAVGPRGAGAPGSAVALERATGIQRPTQ